jgi:hypothetical protein
MLHELLYIFQRLGRLHQHENVETIQLLDNMGIVRRLQRKKPFELV